DLQRWVSITQRHPERPSGRERSCAHRIDPPPVRDQESEGDRIAPHQCAAYNPCCIEETTLPVGTAFHERTFPLCHSLNYREGSGYYAVSVYEVHHEHEYNAIRNAAALIDISPLYKYLITGKDATKLVNRVITRDINKVKVGQVIHCCWC